MRPEDMQKVLEIGVLLSSERDHNRLLEQILECVMDLAHCDAGTLYLLDKDHLRFKIMRNHTMHTYEGGNGKDPTLPPVPLSRENVCAFSLLENRTIRIDDVYNCPDYDFSGPINYDRITRYHTQSMLVVPMHNRSGERVGVLQLINALGEDGKTIQAFPRDMALVLESVASQAAITIQNVWYLRQIKALFQSFVQVMSTAVDQRTPYNGSHTRHMAVIGARFLEYLNEKGKTAFTPEEKEELLMSVWLHDIGKLVTPLEVMNKMARLTPAQHSDFRHRMETVRLHSQIRLLTGSVSQEEYTALIEETRKAEALVEAVDSAGYLPDEKLAALEKLAAATWTDQDGNSHPWVTPAEAALLSIRKGTLSDKERQIMEEHVQVTDKLLSQIQFSDDLSHVRQWAASHHELLDGSGYPCHLTGEQIPLQVRIITILDIFDALVADDRPYKPGMPVAKALSILDSMANREGKLDPELTRYFIESNCWEGAYV